MHFISIKRYRYKWTWFKNRIYIHKTFIVEWSNTTMRVHLDNSDWRENLDAKTRTVLTRRKAMHTNVQQNKKNNGTTEEK